MAGDLRDGDDDAQINPPRMLPLMLPIRRAPTPPPRPARYSKARSGKMGAMVARAVPLTAAQASAMPSATAERCSTFRPATRAPTGFWAHACSLRPRSVRVSIRCSNTSTSSETAAAASWVYYRMTGPMIRGMLRAPVSERASVE